MTLMSNVSSTDILIVLVLNYIQYEFHVDLSRD
jgi:hypothetical protein